MILLYKIQPSNYAEPVRAKFWAQLEKLEQKNTIIKYGHKARILKSIF